MAGEAPPFWWEKADWRAALLWPASLIYGRLAARRLDRARRETFELPVLCVATFALGATGRTQVAMALARTARAMGRRPGLVVRGAGNAHRVDAAHDLPRHVGDTALELAQVAPTAIASDRISAARQLAGDGCDIIIVADGQVGEEIATDYCLVVAEARRGIGNGFMPPAGPVRAPLTSQLAFADAVLKLGTGEGADRIVRLASRAGRPVYEAALSPAGETPLAGRRFLAFAGIGDPAQFFEAVEAAGGEIVDKRPYGDGHPYAEDELQSIMAAADAAACEIVTTGKDALRLAHSGGAAEQFRPRLVVLRTETEFELARIPETILADALEAFRKRATR